ncbi:MAG TPA: hypothetical protein VIY51_02250 [Xanthobacteraceae bacterium]
MAQLLLTFDEIADLFHSDAAGARRRVIENQWERRRCTDGLTRVLAPADVAHDFMLDHAAKHESRVASTNEFAGEFDNEFDAAMAALRRVFGSEADNARQGSTVHLYSEAS